MKQTTLEGNKLIAEFMGGIPCYITVKSVGEMEAYRFFDATIPIDEIFYNTSWEWLMPCYKKASDMILSGDIEHDKYSKELWEFLEQSILLVNIDSAHNYFSQFIQWYNTQTPTP